MSLFMSIKGKGLSSSGRPKEPAGQCRWGGFLAVASPPQPASSSGQSHRAQPRTPPGHWSFTSCRACRLNAGVELRILGMALDKLHPLISDPLGVKKALEKALVCYKTRACSLDVDLKK